MDDFDRDLVASSTREVLLEHTGPSLVEALQEIGWFELLESAPSIAVGTMFEVQGANLVATSMLDVVMAPDFSGHVVHALPGKAAPARDGSPDGVEVEGIVLSPPGPDAMLLFPCRQNGALACATAPSACFEVTPIEGLDPWAGRVRVTGHAPQSALAPSSLSWEDAVTAGRRAVAHELVGITREMLRLAVEHTTTREQFGRPIGTFQAVQHRLADVCLALEPAELALEEVWVDPGPWTATMAKLLAGSAARMAAKHCQQVLGGMGFTWEHPLHRYIRRSIQLDWLLGSTLELQRAVGSDLLSARSVPGGVTL